MTPSPKVSLLMAAHNSAAYIGAAIESVLAQTYEDWELLVVDDGSTDATAATAASYTDPRIRLFRQPKGGVGRARNTALEHVTGSVIGVFDSDDLLPPASLETRMRKLLDEDLDLVSGSIHWFRTEPLDLERRWTPAFDGDPLPRLVRMDPRAFFSMSYLMRIGPDFSARFPEDMTHVEDLLFWIRACAGRPKRMGHLTDDVYHYRQHSNNAMQNLVGLERSYWQLLGRLTEEGFLPTRRDREYLRLRILRIMVLSHARAGQYRRALGVVKHGGYLRPVFRGAWP